MGGDKMLAKVAHYSISFESQRDDDDDDERDGGLG